MCSPSPTRPNLIEYHSGRKLAITFCDFAVPQVNHKNLLVEAHFLLSSVDVVRYMRTSQTHHHLKDLNRSLEFKDAEASRSIHVSVSCRSPIPLANELQKAKKLKHMRQPGNTRDDSNGIKAFH